MNTAFAIKTLTFLATTTVVTMTIAYFSNTHRLPSWCKDAWLILMFVGLAIYLGISLGVSAPGIACVTSIFAITGISVLVILRRGQRKHLQR